MNGVDIGTLAGRIEFEDRISATMEAVFSKVDKLDARFGGLNTSVQSVAGGFILAEVAIKAVEKAIDIGVDVIRDFTTEGASIADVEDNFNRLALGAGRVGETMLGVLRQGTHNTITDFQLMKDINDQFTAGVHLTDAQMKTLAEGGFALAQSKGLDVAQVFDQINQAMLTGNARSVRSLVGQIDLSKAQDDYAKKLGTTRERLTEVEQQEAGRVAILDKVSDATHRLGEQTDGIDEIISQVTTNWNNFYEDLIKSVAKSPAVVLAFTTIRDSLYATFGGSDALLETFLSGVDHVADFVTSHAPTIIGWFGKIKDGAVALWGGAVDAWQKFGPVIVTAFGLVEDWVIDIYNAVITTWNALPEWMKLVAERSALTAAGLYIVKAGADAASGGILSIAGNMATITSGLTSLPELLKKVGMGLAGMKVLWAVLDFSSLADTSASFGLLAGSIASTIGPLGIATIYAGALFAAYELGKWQPVSDFFMELGLELQGFSQAEQDAMIATDKQNQAMIAQSKTQKEHADVLALIDEINAKMLTTTQATIDAMHVQGAVVTTNTDRTKEYTLAWESLNRLGTTYKTTLDAINPSIRDSVMEYANLGAKVEDLFQAFPKLTKAEAEAAVQSVQSAREIAQVNLETFGIISKAHGDNINDWIEGEHRKLAMTLESLKIQGALSDERMKAEMAKFDAMIDSEIRKRNEADKFSREYYQKQVDDAQAAFDLIMRDTTIHTDNEIRESHRLLEERQRDLEHWTSIANDSMTQQTAVVEAETSKQGAAVANLGQVWQDTVGRAIKDSEQMVRTLGGEIMSVADFKAKQLQGGTSDIKPLTKTELDNLRKQWVGGGPAQGDDAIWHKLSELENLEGTYVPHTAEEYFAMIKDQILLAQLRMWAATQGGRPKVPGFRDGGVGDFKDGTLAMLHGPEVIVPLDKFGGMGHVTNNFYVNGTAEESARKISQILIRDFKTGRQLNFK